MSIQRIAVIGAGQMGNGIAQVLGSAHFQVLLLDSSPEALKKGISTIEGHLIRAVEKEKITKNEKDKILAQITPTDSLSSIKNVDIVIEAVVENLEVKTKLFSELDLLCKKETLLASNTSSISITKLAASTKRPSQVIGMHFMNPVPVMQLVEIIRGIQTSEASHKIALEVVKKCEKTPVTIHHDYPGFLVNRILIPMLNEAFFALQEGIATPEEIDTAMKLGTHQPMGPLELADFVGLDTCLAICQILHRDLGEDKYRPCPLLIKYVEAGWVGRKAGRGVYNY